MKSKTKKLIQKDKKYVWHPFTQMQSWEKEPILVIEEGKGSYLKDTEGNWYLDGVSSLWVNVHGHRKKEIDKALNKQIKKLAHSTLLGLGSESSIELAEKIIEVAPKGLSRVFYSDSGSTAVEIALKIAFQYWQQKDSGQYKKKKKFLNLTNAYHGDTLGAVSVGGMDLFHQVYSSLLFESFQAPSPHCYRCKLTPLKANNSSLRVSGNLASQNPPAKKVCAWQCADKMEQLIKKHHRELAAVIVEPLMQGAAGMHLAPPGFLKKVRQLCTRYNVLLIVDEVATGFGRTGKMFACEHENVKPDLMAVAKGLTGGYLPLAATLATERVYNVFKGKYSDLKTFFHGHTYTGNALASAAAVKNLELFKKEKVLKKLQPKIELMEKELLDFESLDSVGEVRQAGMMVGIELIKNKQRKVSFPWEEKMGMRVCEEARQLGAILRPLGNTIILMPPLSISKKELRNLLKITYRSILKVCDSSTKENGFHT